MKKYFAPILAAFVGFVMLGPIGSALGVMIWWMVKHTDLVVKK